MTVIAQVVHGARSKRVECIDGASSLMRRIGENKEQGESRASGCSAND